jgi:hypothetical protein
MSSITVRQSVFSDLDELARLFDQYRVFQGKETAFVAARAFLQALFVHEKGRRKGVSQLRV